MTASPQSPPDVPVGRGAIRGRSARPYIALSLCAAIVTIGLKAGAYLLTGSVGFFSDAVESLVNLAAAIGALWALTLAERPPDEEHLFGHSKAEYFSSGLESAFILVAAAGIAFQALTRLSDPPPLEQVPLGLAVSLAASAVNGGVALVLLRAGRRLRSITLRADAQHLLTDVASSVGIGVGVVLVQLTGWLILDPLIALAVAANIVWAGVRLLNETAHGLLDTALPDSDQRQLAAVLGEYEARGIVFHALRTRAAGRRRFVSVHALVPGAWSVQRGHDLAEMIEHQILGRLPETNVLIHVEPVEDPASLADQELDRTAPG